MVCTLHVLLSFYVLIMKIKMVTTVNFISLSEINFNCRLQLLYILSLHYHVMY